MGVQLNIKDFETVRLAKELASASGTSVTAVIRQALERETRRRAAESDALLAELHALNPDPRALLAPEWRDRTSVEIADSIYDADGSFSE